jgi:hypothetical protein
MVEPQSHTYSLNIYKMGVITPIHHTKCGPIPYNLELDTYGALALKTHQLVGPSVDLDLAGGIPHPPPRGISLSGMRLVTTSPHYLPLNQGSPSMIPTYTLLQHLVISDMWPSILRHTLQHYLEFPLHRSSISRAMVVMSSLKGA